MKAGGDRDGHALPVGFLLLERDFIVMLSQLNNPYAPWSPVPDGKSMPARTEGARLLTKGMTMNRLRLKLRKLMPAAMTAAMASTGLFVGSAHAQTAPGTVVARVGEATISQTDIEQLLRTMPEATRAEAKANRAGLENWMRERLVGEALLREAQSKGWAERAEVKARIDAAVRETTARIVASTYLASVAPVP